MTDETLPEEIPVDAPVPEETQAEPPPEVVETADDASHEEKPKGGFQRRIKELADERNHWREMALRAQTPSPTPEPPKVEQPTKLPTLEEFGYDEAKYQGALIEYATKQAEAVVERRLTQAEQQRAEQTRLSSFAERQQAFAKTAPDFEEVVLRDPTLPITAGMRDVIIDSPTGPEIAYYLATNRELAEQIARLPPHLAALEMGRIEGRLQAVKEVKAKAPVVTKAPPPAPSIEAVEPEIDRDPDSMSMGDWIKWREKQLRKRR